MVNFLNTASLDMYGNSIRKDNGYDAASYTYYPVAIIGAGESGIGVGCRLKEVLHTDQFRIFDRQSGIGGTWWINRYPGVACDIPAIFYSFSFCPNSKWTTLYPQGPEIVKYLQGVCDTYQIVDKIQLNTDVRECRWLENEQVWELTLQHLMAGVGDLSEYDRAQKIADNSPDADGKATDSKTIPADTIILANGFEVLKWLHPLDITGRNGVKLHDVFDTRGGPQMYMGMALDGFPNFFTIFGPNTATGHSSVVLASENMINMSLKFIGPILKGDVLVAEIKKEAELEWTRDTQEALKKRVWNMGGCASWYKTEGGWNSTVYPYTQIWFTYRCMFPTWRDWDITYTRKGLLKWGVKRVTQMKLLLSLVYGVVRAQQNGIAITTALRNMVKIALLKGAEVLHGVGLKL